MRRGPKNDAILERARCWFPAFYAEATEKDSVLLDRLILSWAALRNLVTIPRRLVPVENRNDLERACDAAEQGFMRARDRVRECPTFRNLVPSDQRRTAAILFDVYPPTK